MRDLFSFDTESELKEMGVGETTEENVPEKKNTKSQNAFEQVRGATWALRTEFVWGKGSR